MQNRANKRIDNFIKWLVPALIGIIGTIALLFVNSILFELKQIRIEISKINTQIKLNELEIKHNKDAITKIENINQNKGGINYDQSAGN